MNISTFCRFTFGICAAVGMLVGCGRSQPPIGAPGMLLPQRTSVGQDGHRLARIATSSGDLLYVAQLNQDTLSYTYPGGQLVGSIPYFGGGPCSDQSGNIFLVTNVIYEFSHGGSSPINTLNPPSGYGFTSLAGCSVDPATGNLAVAVNCFSCGFHRGVAVYPNAQGPPTVYTAEPYAFPMFCGYDKAGNLFVDGFVQRKRGPPPFWFGELPKGGSSVRNVTLNQKIYHPGQVQWDGNYVTITDQRGPKVYRVQVSGSTATVVGTTLFSGTAGDKVQQSWIEGNTIIFPFINSQLHTNNVGFWNYPAGGYATKSFQTQGYGRNFGVTVSVASSK
jgi:hypothetical protein